MPRTYWCLFVALLSLWQSGASLAGENLIDVEAYAGTPFGVGMIRVGRAAGRWDRLPAAVTFDVEGADNRIHYPTFFRESAPGSATGDDLTARGTLFLFTGDAPLSVQFHDSTTSIPETITVQRDDEARTKLLKRWWRQYRLSAAEGMPIVENYTTLMLARRLGLTPPERIKRGDWSEDQMLGALLGFEELRLAMQAERLLGDGEAQEKIDLPIPDAVLPPAIAVPEPGNAEIEPLAAHVPEECFYLRFGSYSNYRWFRDTMNTWGGNLREITATRSLDYEINSRLERQLVLKDSDLGRLLGETAINDMAVIGTDTFLREGASIGVLFREKQPGLLGAAIRAQRLAAIAAGESVEEETVEMSGVKVSLLTAPGNVVRSYYVVDGQYHFVTTSSTLAKRFLETGKGTRPLADLKEFKYARSKHPVSAGNPILAYLSDPFIRQLVSPAYRVEMTRRMQADTDVELVALGRLAAIGEGAAHGSVDELVAGGFLPPKFGKRPDETLPLIVGNEVVDSLRGARRTFLPVADVLVSGVTKSEDAAYRSFTQFYQGLYRRMDPISISLTRTPAGPQRERIVLDLSITPFTRQNLGAAANWLPPAANQRVATSDNVLLFLELGSPQSRLFAGLVDREVPFQVSGGAVAYAPQIERRPPVFVGEYGRGLARQFLAGGEEKQENGYFQKPDKAGTADLQFGREWGDWWAASASDSVLPEITPTFKIVDGPRPAQLHLHVGDLGASKLGPFIRAQQYVREREASRVNARLLDSFTQQLNVKDAGARDAAFAVLGAKPVCPLGGEYRRDPPDYQFTTHQPWFSSAWPAPETPWTVRSFAERIARTSLREIPADYQPRLLSWFKALDVEVRFEDQTMYSRIDLEVATH